MIYNSLYDDVFRAFIKNERDLFGTQAALRKQKETYVDNTVLPLTMREWATHLTRPATIFAVFGIAVILMLVAPFGTKEQLSMGGLLVFWSLMCLGTYVWGSFIGYLLSPVLKTGQPWVRVCITGAITGVGNILIVSGLNYAFLSWFPGPSLWLNVFGTIFIVTFIVAALIDRLSAHQFQTTAVIGASTDPTASTDFNVQQIPLLERLPHNSRAPIISLSVEDHYVRVKTTKGETLILMRLRDAIKEVSQLSGTQIHRSHWVAFDEIHSAQKDGTRLVLSLKDGTKLPVSRANVTKIKEAGFAP